MDSDRDNLVCPSELFRITLPGAFGREFQQFQQFIVEEMKLGAANEDVSSLPGVRLQDLVGDPAFLFSFDGLRALTEIFNTKRGIAAAFSAKLDAAEMAAARGNIQAKVGALNAYINQTAAQANKSLTRRACIMALTVPKITSLASQWITCVADRRMN